MFLYPLEEVIAKGDYMECNFLMERQLVSVNLKEIRPLDEYKIWKAYNMDGNPFWGVGSFCGIDTEHVIKYGRELTNLEWEGNEILIHEEDQKMLTEHAAAVYLSLKHQMQQSYPETEFDLLVSVNLKDHTSSIRFWAVRDDYHYIEITHKSLAQFQEEAVLIDTVNKIDIRKQVDLFLSNLSGYELEMEREPDETIMVIKNPTGQNHIKVCFDCEMTMSFGRFHAHYVYAEADELWDDVNGILTGKYAVTCIESGGAWMGSGMAVPDDIPLTSKKKLLKYLFGNQKDFYRKVNQNGGIYSLTFWDSQQNQTYHITETGVFLSQE